MSVEHARGTRRAASRDRGRLVFKHTLSSVKRSGRLVFYGRLMLSGVFVDIELSLLVN